MKTFTDTFLHESIQIIDKIDRRSIENVVNELIKIRSRNGRVFILGVGGSAANASHAVNDFRKICGIECYAPTDNISELTARTNDEGWNSIFVEWLKISRIDKNDGLLILSVGGGDLKRNISPNIVKAVEYAKKIRSSIIGIVGRDGGYTAANASSCVVIPTINTFHITPHTESFQALIWHLLVSHPKLKILKTKWESEK